MEPLEVMLWVSVAVLPAALLFDLVVLARHPGKWRRRITALLIPLALSLLLLVPGSYGLKKLGLVWRCGARLCLSLLLLACLIGLLVFAAWYLIERLEGRVVCQWGVVIAAFALSVCVLAAGAFITLFSTGEDQVITWEGQRVVAVRPGPPDAYRYFAYYGPLLRGDTELNRNWPD